MSEQQSVFLICPLRCATEEQHEIIRCQVAFLEEQGMKVHWPARDTRQTGAEIAIVARNRAAMAAADVVYVIYDGKSEGCLFGLGMAYAMGKPLRAVIGYAPRATWHKSFANLIYQMEEEQAA